MTFTNTNRVSKCEETCFIDSRYLSNARFTKLHSWSSQTQSIVSKIITPYFPLILEGGNRSLSACTTIFDSCPILLHSEMLLVNTLFIISCIYTLCINNILCNNNNQFIKQSSLRTFNTYCVRRSKIICIVT